MLLTWGFAFLLSMGLRFWGLQHPEVFTIRYPLVVVLVFAPSIMFGLLFAFDRYREAE